MCAFALRSSATGAAGRCENCALDATECSCEINRSGSSINERSESQSKRQRADSGPVWRENETLTLARSRTFSHWPQSNGFCKRLIQAGFTCCNADDQVICLYCLLTFANWNTELDDPCEVHQTLSPNCLFVKSMQQCAYSLCHIDQVDRETRSASYADWSKATAEQKTQFALAGFFLDGSVHRCFFCDGTLEADKIQSSHPLAEHVRAHPYCKFVKQMCGDALYACLRRVFHASQGAMIVGVRRQPLAEFTPKEIDDMVNARIDLEVSLSLMEKGFDRSIVMECYRGQLRLKHDDFASAQDAYLACTILKIRREREAAGFQPAIPSEAMRAMRGLNAVVPPASPPPMIPDGPIGSSASIQRELNRYAADQQRSSATFVEAMALLIERERSLADLSGPGPSQSAINAGGWTWQCGYFQCPHCYMRYRKWRVGDNPLQIHRELSPHCPFVLSCNPLGADRTPKPKLGEHFTSSDIDNAENTPYNGLAKARFGPMAELPTRCNTFLLGPNPDAAVAADLAKAGFYLSNDGRALRCFYCTRSMRFGNNIQSAQSWIRLHSLSRCLYSKQLNDVSRQAASQPDSNRCPWCMEGDKHLVALPCRHHCLCTTCGQTKRLCPVCQAVVQQYVTVYSG